MQFFSQGAYRNPMVVRVAGLAYQEGFGGHFHNDNAVGVLRDVPGLVVACPGAARRRRGDAAHLPGRRRRRTARSACSWSRSRSTTPVTCTPTATAGGSRPYPAPADWADAHVPIGRARVDVVGSGDDLTIITFGNGVRMSLRAAAALAAEGIGARVVDLRWLAPAAGRRHDPGGRGHRPGADRRRDPPLRRGRRGRAGRAGRRRVCRALRGGWPASTRLSRSVRRRVTCLVSEDDHRRAGCTRCAAWQR